MEQGLEEAGADNVAQSVSYALKRDRWAIQKLDSCDDEGHSRAARRIVEYLRLCGYRFFRKPIDWRSRYPASTSEPTEGDN